MLGIRPADLEVASDTSTNVLSGVADLVEFHGNDALVTFLFGGSEVGALVKAAGSPKAGDRVRFSLAEPRIHLFDAGTGMTLRRDE